MIINIIMMMILMMTIDTPVVDYYLMMIMMMILMMIIDTPVLNK